MLKLIAREASEEKMNSVFGIKNHISAAVIGALAGCAAPGSASEYVLLEITFDAVFSYL